MSGNQDNSKKSASWASKLSFRNISAIYIFIALVVIFGILVPDPFLTIGVWRTLFDAQVVTALAALAVLVPLITGNFNLAVGTEVGFAGLLVAFLIAKTGLPFPFAIAVSVLAGILIGLISGLIITKAKIDSFITTLGMSSILLAGMAWVSDRRQILNLGDDFRIFGSTQFFGVTLPVLILVFVSLIAWYFLDLTSIGRRMYATGFNKDSARLSGIKTDRLIVGSLMAGGAIAAIAGVLMTARISAGDPTAGPGLLLPAFAAVFLGSTQFKGGRFNVWGTIVAVYVLAIGVKGLQLMGTPSWITDLFNGVALLLAVGFAKYESSTGKRGGAIRRMLPKALSKNKERVPVAD